MIINIGSTIIFYLHFSDDPCFCNSAYVSISSPCTSCILSEVVNLHLLSMPFLHGEPEDDIDLVLEVGRGHAAAVELLVGQAGGQLVHLHLVLQD